MTAIQIACIGDVMCGDQFNQLGWGAASQVERYGEKFVDPGIVAVLKAHDMTLCNVECVLSDVGRNENNVRSLHMRGRPQFAERLTQWGITTANLANNHILEQGQAAAEDTAATLRRTGIIVTGTDTNGTFQVNPGWTEKVIRGHKISMLGFCLRNEKYAYHYCDDLSHIYRQIQQRYNQGNIVIVSVHWGDELIDRPSLEQRRTASMLLEAGAVLVAGHHPHVMQGIWRKNDGLVIYSSGNFIFDSWCRHTKWSMIVSIKIENGRVQESAILPIIRGENFRPMLAEGECRECLMREIERRNSIAQAAVENPSLYQAQYDSELKKLNYQDRLGLYWRILTTFWKSKPRYWIGILNRPVQRRLGRW